ncbi:MAG TPA: hypothetical protein P5544_08735 [Candidatus Nanopelagicales bacterium]|nr:hypothetical protein [Candidatus Nanopelagicales bacterium]
MDTFKSAVALPLGAILLAVGSPAEAGIIDEPGYPWTFVSDVCAYPDAAWPEWDSQSWSQFEVKELGFDGQRSAKWNCLWVKGPDGGNQGATQGQAVPVGTPIRFHKSDLQIPTSGLGPTGVYARELTRVRWDFGNDGDWDVVDTGPWPKGYRTTTLWMQYGTAQPGGCLAPTCYSVQEPFTRATDISLTHTFHEVGTQWVKVEATYSDDSVQSATGAVVIEPDLASVQVAPEPGLVLSDSPTKITAELASSSGFFESIQWDLDGDGVYETLGKLETGPALVTASVQRAWDSAGVKTVGVRATSRGGDVASAISQVEVRETPPTGETGVSINVGEAFTNSKQVDLDLIWPAYATSARVSNDGGFAANQTQTVGLQQRVSWGLDDSVEGRNTKVVYVRFNGSGIDNTKTYSDDIILDTQPPEIVTASATQAGASAASRLESSRLAAKKVKYRVKVRARDKLTGVRTLQLGATKSPARARTISYHTRTLLSLPKSSKLYLRAQDGAGNWTKWRALLVKKGRR